MPENPNMPIGYDSWEQYEAECEAELRDARLKPGVRIEDWEGDRATIVSTDPIRLTWDHRPGTIVTPAASYLARGYTILDDEPCPPAEPREFGDLSGAESQPIRLQGGVVFLKPYGCSYCGNAFWTENDDKRRLSPGLHPCPHCGKESRVPDALTRT